MECWFCSFNAGLLCVHSISKISISKEWSHRLLKNGLKQYVSKRYCPRGILLDNICWNFIEIFWESVRKGVNLAVLQFAIAQCAYCTLVIDNLCKGKWSSQMWHVQANSWIKKTWMYTVEIHHCPSSGVKLPICSRNVVHGKRSEPIVHQFPH